MNRRFDGSDLFAPEPGLFLDRGFVTRPGTAVGPDVSWSESFCSEGETSKWSDRIPGVTGLDASSSCWAALAASVAATMPSASGRSVLVSKVAVSAAMMRIRLLKAGQREDDRYSLEQREQRDEAVRRKMAVAV